MKTDSEIVSLLQSVNYPFDAAHRKLREVKTLPPEHQDRLIRTWEHMANTGKSFGTAWTEVQQRDALAAGTLANESLANSKPIWMISPTFFWRAK